MNPADWHRMLPRLAQLCSDAGVTVVEAERQVRSFWTRVTGAVLTASVGLVRLPALPSSLRQVARAADLMLTTPPPSRAGGPLEEAHAQALLAFADLADELGPDGYETAGWGVGILSGGAGGGGGVTVAGIVGGTATAPTGAGPIIGGIAAALGVQGALLSVIVGVAAIVVGLWARLMWSSGAPAAWRAEAAELMAGTPPPPRYTVPVAPIDPGAGRVIGRPEPGGAATDEGLGAGELLAMASLAWAIFGR